MSAGRLVFFLPDKVQPINVRRLSHSAVTDKTKETSRDLRSSICTYLLGNRESTPIY